MLSSLVFSGDLPASILADRLKRGELARLYPGVYTTDTLADPREVVREHLYVIGGRLLPEAVITDRSARTGAAVDGVLYLSRPGRRRTIQLPGLTVSVRFGAGPIPGDIALPGGWHLASRERGLAENCLACRSRQGIRRTLDAAELGDWVDYLCRNEGLEQLRDLRRGVEQAAAQLGISPEQLRPVQTAFAVAQGSAPAKASASAALTSRRKGSPVDQERVRRFRLLQQALSKSAPQSHALVAGREALEPFFEAYFSNFIEGTEFEVEEAARIVFDGDIPAQRPQDAHDILATFQLVADPDHMSKVGADAGSFLDLLKQRNASIMGGRSQLAGGAFKQQVIRAGDTHFVDPLLVEGTLAAGFALRQHLDTAWERAVYIAFVVSEVHPFTDGNGRTARVMMNAEMHAGGQTRLIIPTVYRQDYLDGLRMLSRREDPNVFIKVMRYAHDFTASIDFSDWATAVTQLTAAHAFNEPDSPHRLRVR